jgi:hypothetical protein
MSTQTAGLDALLAYQWETQPAAGRFVIEAGQAVTTSLPWAAQFAQRLYTETGNRFYDLFDTIYLSAGDARVQQAIDAGWAKSAEAQGLDVYDNDKGMFPSVAVVRGQKAGKIGVDLKVEFVVDFLAANDLTRPVKGGPWARARHAMIEETDAASLGISERHGHRGYGIGDSVNPADVLEVYDRFRTRPRDVDDAEGFRIAGELIDEAIDKIGRDYACDRFFAAERDYWQKRNRAARAQKARQDKLGIGWANHDHHTYRSSRECFKDLVAIWEKLGLFCRERFYAGKDAGWGAQVMEHPVTRIITFNDVDLSAEELMGDFSHDGLAARDHLGTVGLWCGLHGEAFLQAGMHHLECMFDFEALKTQLEAEHGIRTMKPFTDFAYLRQAFTEGERWKVSEKRMQRLLDRKLVTTEQVDKWKENGAIGSHLENLERNDGFKGFNQHGVSEIISATDPRKQADASAFDTVKYKTVGSH